jgi:NADH-quinone oxidoreductase subunit G
MLESPRKAYLLHGLEPDQDLADRETGLKALESADFVVALTPWDTPALRGVAHVLLPVGTFAETAGTFVNAEGRWQSFAGCANPVGQARPAWKVLRVLGNLVELPDCDYESAVEVRDELAGRLRADAPPDTRYQGEFEAGGETRPAVALELLDVPIYAVDALVRRAAALQATRLALAPREPIPATLVANA